MTLQDKLIDLKMHFKRLVTYVTFWNKFRDLKMHFKSLETFFNEKFRDLDTKFRDCCFT